MYAAIFLEISGGGKECDESSYNLVVGVSNAQFRPYSVAACLCKHYFPRTLAPFCFGSQSEDVLQVRAGFRHECAVATFRD